MKKTILVSIVVFPMLLGCGKESVAQRDNLNLPVAPPPAETPDPKAGDSTSAPAPAPALTFTTAELAGDVKWDAPITADEPAAFEVKFWASADSTRAAIAPKATPVAFFVMKCCKTVTDVSLQAVNGVYRAEGIRLGAGEYSLVIQLGPGKTAERSTLDIVVP